MKVEKIGLPAEAEKLVKHCFSVPHLVEVGEGPESEYVVCYDYYMPDDKWFWTARAEKALDKGDIDNYRKYTHNSQASEKDNQLLVYREKIQENLVDPSKKHRCVFTYLCGPDDHEPVEKWTIKQILTLVSGI